MLVPASMTSFAPSVETIPVKAQKPQRARVVSGSRPENVSVCSGLTLCAPDPDYLRFSEDDLCEGACIAGGQLVVGEFSPRRAGRDDLGHQAVVVGGDMGQPRTPSGVAQSVEPAAGNADRLQMVVHRNELPARKANRLQPDVVGVDQSSRG
ncbi:hypothetical protein A5724_17675 [Mycobacterium sp. ACS1612]|nr:hypothetical protein A5724_17675 [Mycobacterium sp. ACS1612]